MKQGYAKIVLGIVVAMFFALIAWIAFLSLTATGQYDDFAKCLTEKGFAMGGTDWCNYCKEQKSLFGLSFKHINYKNCDLEKQWCNENNVDRYPAWVSPGGQTHTGLKSLEQLGSLSGCSLP